MNIFRRIKTLETTVSELIKIIGKLNSNMITLYEKPTEKEEERIFISSVPEFQKEYVKERLRGTEKGDK